jgi:hypothetical protein
MGMEAMIYFNSNVIRHETILLELHDHVYVH